MTKKKPWEVDGTIWKTEAAWINWLRGMLREGWKNYPLKIIYKNSKKYQVENTNPKSMKRFPKVSRIDCEICGKTFPFDRVSTEVDHIGESGTLRKITDVENEIIRLFFVDPKKDLRVLCKSCHSIVSHQQLHGVSFEEAKLLKEVIAIIKENTVDDIVDFCYSYGYFDCSNAAKRKANVEAILKECCL